MKQKDAIRRIQKMELCFDALRSASESQRNTACFQALLNSFIQYYEGGKWRSDCQAARSRCRCVVCAVRAGEIWPCEA